MALKDSTRFKSNHKKKIINLEKLREYYIITKYYEAMLNCLWWDLKMNIGALFLNINLTGIITFYELDWVTKNQSDFTRLEESIAIKLGRMIDSGYINIGCRLKA